MKLNKWTAIIVIAVCVTVAIVGYLLVRREKPPTVDQLPEGPWVSFTLTDVSAPSSPYLVQLHKGATYIVRADPNGSRYQLDQTSDYVEGQDFAHLSLVPGHLCFRNAYFDFFYCMPSRMLDLSAKYVSENNGKMIIESAPYTRFVSSGGVLGFEIQDQGVVTGMNLLVLSLLERYRTGTLVNDSEVTFTDGVFPSSTFRIGNVADLAPYDLRMRWGALDLENIQTQWIERLGSEAFGSPLVFERDDADFVQLLIDTGVNLETARVRPDVEPL